MSDFGSGLTIIIGATGFIINMLVLAIGGVWKLSRVEAALMANIGQVKDTLSKEIEDHRANWQADHDRQRREFGETVAAIRQKITEVEIWSRDHFVRRESFYEVTAQLTADLKAIRDLLDSRLEKFDEKLDRLRPLT